MIGAEYGAVGEPVGRIDHDTMRVRTSGRHLRRARLDPPGRIDWIDDERGVGVRRGQQEAAAAVGDDICHGAEQRRDGEVRQPAAGRIDGKAGCREGWAAQRVEEPRSGLTAIGRLVGDGRARSIRLSVLLSGSISKAKISLVSAFETYAIVLATHSSVMPPMPAPILGGKFTGDYKLAAMKSRARRV